VHQLIVNDCKDFDAGSIKCVCGDLSTKASLEVKKREEKPKVSVEDQDVDEGRIKGKYKGTRDVISTSGLARSEDSRLLDRPKIFCIPTFFIVGA
jgi:hypothetical protein